MLPVDTSVGRARAKTPRGRAVWGALNRIVTAYLEFAELQTMNREAR